MRSNSVYISAVKFTPAPARRRADLVRFFRARTLKPYGIQAFRKSQPVKSAVPLSRSVSRRLSRWFVCIFSGLGRLSRCPAHNLTRMYMHPHTRHSIGTTGTAGQLCLLLSFSLLNQRVKERKICPAGCPALSRGSVLIKKTNKIWGFYCHE